MKQTQTSSSAASNLLIVSNTADHKANASTCSTADHKADASTCSTADQKEREYLFDNYKVLLIALVVIGHFIEPCDTKGTFLYDLKWAIVAFHMPAFVFISGYFSKRIPSPKKLIQGLVIPHFVYEILYYLLYTFVLDKSTGFYFARPKFSLWYLMALFAWRVMSPLVRKIPHHILWSLLAGLIIGLYPIGNFLSIPRIFFFFPFFLAGQNFDSSVLNRFRNKTGYFAALLTLATFFIYLFVDNYHTTLSQKIFYGRYSYGEMHLGNTEGILIRIICYAVSFLLIYLFMLVLPTEKKSYSYLGQRTMAIYIFHGFVFSCLRYGSDILTSVEGNAESMMLIAFCLFLVWFLSRKPFVAVTNKISHLLG